MRVSNWAKNQTSRPTRKWEPTDEKEVQKIVQTVRGRGESLRVVGANHSWSGAAQTDGHLISLDRMNQVRSIDLENARVTVDGGIRLKHLVRELSARGLAMPNLGSIAEQSIAGVISTGTHGTGLTSGNIATQVVSLRLVDGKGEVHEIDGNDRLEAARVSLGMLGIITEVTLQCVPAFRLKETAWTLTFDEATQTMCELVEAHEFIKFWWLPHIDRVQAYAFAKTEEPIDPPSEQKERIENLVNTYVFGGVLSFQKLAPITVPAINKIIGLSYLRPYTRVDRADRIFTVPMPPRHLESEYAIPWRRAPEMMRAMKNMIDGQNLRVGFVNEIRFVAGDSGWLSPAHSEPVCQFGAYIGKGKDADTFFDGFDQFAHDMGGRPHWGKLFSATPEYLRRVFPKYDAFCALRENLDPDCVFDNAFTKAHFPR